VRSTLTLWISALLILDGAGWHGSPQLIVPENNVLMPLPNYAPEPNATKNIWEVLLPAPELAK